MFQPLIQLGYVSEPLWSHRGLTYSLLGGVVAVSPILGGLLGMKYNLERPINVPTRKRTLERFR